MSGLLLRCATAVIYGAALVYTFFYLPPLYFTLLLASLLGIILVHEYPKIAQRDRRWWWLVPLYPILPVLCLIALNHSPHRVLLIYLFVLMSLFDTGAYVVGRWCGRTKLSRWSPQKTWEGVGGGVLFAGLGLLGLRHWLFTGTGAAASWQLVVVLLAVSVLAVTGDLFESWLKRQAGLKDSSALLPGHGGLLGLRAASGPAGQGACGG